jgi:hypothetical protein
MLHLLVGSTADHSKFVGGDNAASRDHAIDRCGINRVCLPEGVMEVRPISLSASIIFKAHERFPLR